MTKEEVQKALDSGKANIQSVPQNTSTPAPAPIPNPVEEFIQVLSALRLPKQALTTEPEFSPKNFLEQIQFFDDGVDRKVYFHFNGVWSYITLT